MLLCTSSGANKHNCISSAYITWFVDNAIEMTDTITSDQCSGYLIDTQRKQPGGKISTLSHAITNREILWK